MMNKVCLRNRSGIRLRDHQRLAVEHMGTQRSLLVVFGTGQGKSLTAAFAAKCLSNIERVVVITKLSIIDQFRREFAKVWNTNTVSFATIESFLRKKKKPPAKGTFLIVDEAHNLRNPRGNNARGIMEFASQCDKVMLLTATPFVNGTEDRAVPHALLTG